MWRVFSPEAGYSIEEMCLVEASGFPAPRRLEDPAVTGQREEIGATPNATYLMVAARKVGRTYGFGEIQQSDYARTWLAVKRLREAGQSQPPADGGAAPAAKQRETAMRSEEQ